MAAFTAFGNLVDRVNTLESGGSFNLLSSMSPNEAGAAITIAASGKIAFLKEIESGDTDAPAAFTASDVLEHESGYSAFTSGQIFRLFHTGPTDSPYYEITFTNAGGKVVTIYPQEAYTLIYYVTGLHVIPGIINAGDNTA